MNDREHKRGARPMQRVTMRKPEDALKLAAHFGDEAARIMFAAIYLEQSAEPLAGRNDPACFARLLESCYLLDVVNDFVRAQSRVWDTFAELTGAA